MTQTITTTLS